MLYLCYLAGAGPILRASPAPPRRQFLQMALLGAGLLVLSNWHQLFILLGLAYFGQWDRRQRAVPARLFDGWCLLILLTTPQPYWQVAATWLIGLGALALATGGMGSADVLAICALSFSLSWTASLLLVLTACLSGLLQYAFRPDTIPLLFHLHLAYLLLALTLTL